MTKEYIEREKAIEWFMAFVHMGESDIPAETVISDLKYAIPAADVAPVVRCKDCKWYSELVCGEGKLLGSKGWCNEVMARPMPSNGFCSFGERENNG